MRWAEPVVIGCCSLIRGIQVKPQEKRRSNTISAIAAGGGVLGVARCARTHLHCPQQNCVSDPIELPSVLVNACPYSLWKGETKLGEVEAEPVSASPSVIGGIFKPTLEFREIEPVFQYRLHHVPNQPVLRGHPTPAPPDGLGVPLRRLSAEELQGLDTSDQWILRESDGSIVRVDFLSLQEELGHTAHHDPSKRSWLLLAYNSHSSPKRSNSSVAP